MKTNPLLIFRDTPKIRGFVIIVISLFVGYQLARFMRISPQAAIVVLGSGVVLAVTILMRRADYLLAGWIIMTTFIWIIMNRIMPQYAGFVGRGIFWGLLASIVVAWALDAILRGRRFIPFDDVPVKLALFIFLFWAALGLLTSLDLYNSVKHLAKFCIALGASYMFYNLFSQDKRNIRILINILRVLVILVSFLTVLSAFESIITGVHIYKRISLWFWNPNSLGTFLFISMPILIAAGFHHVERKNLKTFLIGIMFLALFFSFHRTSWVATAAAVFYLLSKKERLKVPILYAIATGLVVGSILTPTYGEDFYFYVTGARYTGRQDIWRGSWNAACHYPVLGTGVGNSIKVTRVYIRNPLLTNQDTHSVYLKNAVEMGFPSAIMLVAIYLLLVRSSWRIENRLKSPYLRDVTRGTTATLIGLFLHGTFENGFFLTSFGASEFTVMFPYILISLPYACKRLDDRRQAPT